MIGRVSATSRAEAPAGVGDPRVVGRDDHVAQALRAARALDHALRSSACPRSARAACRGSVDAEARRNHRPPPHGRDPSRTGTFRAERARRPTTRARSRRRLVQQGRGRQDDASRRNLAIYPRALREDLPVLLVGLDDQSHARPHVRAAEPPTRPTEPEARAGQNAVSTRAIQLGQYGVHFVPSPPDVEAAQGARRRSAHAAPDPRATALAGRRDPRHEERSRGADAERLHAADLASCRSSDWASLEEADKTLALLERTPARRRRAARIVLTLVDRRTRVDERAATSSSGWSRRSTRAAGRRYETHLSRSPRVETLNSATRDPRSILHHARGTEVHAQFRELARGGAGRLGSAIGRASRARARRAAEAPGAWRALPSAT